MRQDDQQLGSDRWSFTGGREAVPRSWSQVVGPNGKFDSCQSRDRLKRASKEASKQAGKQASRAQGGAKRERLRRRYTVDETGRAREGGRVI